MFFKLFHFLALFAYLNIIVYEPGLNPGEHKPYKFDGDSLIEYVLDDLLDVPLSNNLEDIEIPNENYRPFNAGIFIMPALLFISIFLFREIGRLIVIDHPFYRNKSFCLPGYYSFLFRYKPF
jgi:hypothetical protein